MEVVIKVTNIGRYPNPEEIMQALARANEGMIADTIEFLTAKSKEPKTGKTYEASYAGLTHDYTASAPGEYPAEKTGMLMETLYRGETKVTNDTVQTTLNSDQPYAFKLEGMAGGAAGKDGIPAAELKTKAGKERHRKAAYAIVADDDTEGVRPWLTKALEDPELLDQFPDNFKNCLSRVGFK